MSEQLTTDPKVGKGWTWMIEDLSGNWVLCNWAEHDQNTLLEGGRPSPEARMVYVAIVPMKKWRKSK